MKRILVSSIIFTAVLILSIIGANSVHISINPIIAELENLDISSAYKACEMWESSTSLLSFALRHNKLEEISFKFAEFEISLTDEYELEDIIFKSKELIFMLENLIEKEKFYLKNIF